MDEFEDDEGPPYAMIDPMVGRAQTVAQLAVIYDALKTTTAKAAVEDAMKIVNKSMLNAIAPMVTATLDNVVRVDFAKDPDKGK